MCSANTEASDGFLEIEVLDCGVGSSNKSHILKSVACSTNSSTVSPVLSMMAQTSSKERSISETPPEYIFSHAKKVPSVQIFYMIKINEKHF